MLAALCSLLPILKTYLHPQLATYNQLNDAIITSDARTTIFDGQWGFGRFWTKALDDDEAKEHILNFKSVGVKDPFVNFGFTNDRYWVF